ncbi:UNVERIFIED_CONTAM: protein ABC transporter 1, mitochondrial [Sesamum radiatum]|uniref:Protein ABC transporter 1, mitochondrial n=1 Tax=Sesamum radiatum TaxID=300843 RepID=A0AAW2W3V5_SESRA
MISLKDIARLVNGLSLVAKEGVSLPRSAQLKTLIKASVLSAADFAGLTRGKLRSLDIRAPQVDSSDDAHTNAGSVVYFTNYANNPPPKSEAQAKPDADASVQMVAPSTSNGSVDADFQTSVDADQQDVPSTSNAAIVDAVVSTSMQRKPRERRVPSTPFSRAIGFAGLGAGLAWGTLQESAKRNYFGAKILPAPILAALDIVRQGADRMPRNQLNQVLDAELGSNWSNKLMSFDYEPMAAASIGQVHRAVTKDGLEVAVKIQYPGVADSIESDIENVKLLLTYTNLMPEKLYIDNAMKVAKEELSRECDYELEAKNQKRFRSLLTNAKGFYVPFVVDDLSSKRVLTTELVHGVPIDKVALLDQETRDYVGKKLLELTLMEVKWFKHQFSSSEMIKRSTKLELSAVTNACF